MTLVKYRDAGLHTYTYFWVDKKSNIVSPYFDSEEDAMRWCQEKIDGIQRENLSDV